MAPVLGLAALLADTLPVGATEGYQWAVVGGAHPQVPVPGGLRQLVAVQPAVLLVRPQVLRAVVHHAGQAGLDGPHPAGPETEVTQDLLLLLQALCLGSSLPLRALSPSFPWGAPWGAQVLFFCRTGRARVWAESGRRVSGDPAQRAWSHQIQFSHVESATAELGFLCLWAQDLEPQSDSRTTPRGLQLRQDFNCFLPQRQLGRSLLQ